MVKLEETLHTELAQLRDMFMPELSKVCDSYQSELEALQVDLAL